MQSNLGFLFCAHSFGEDLAAHILDTIHMLNVSELKSVVLSEGFKPLSVLNCAPVTSSI
jgi:hypothetical protein